MKEATGELNMTVIVIIAIVAIGALFTIFVYPMIKTGVVSQTCKTYGANYQAVQRGTFTNAQGEKEAQYECCPDGKQGDPRCVQVEAKQ